MAPAARKSRSAGPPPPSRTLILDNGAHSIKAGFATDDTDDDPSSELQQQQQQPRVIPNCIARDRHRKTYVGSELEKCKDFGEISLRRPVEKGFVVNWEAEKEIWDREFFDEKAAAAGDHYCDPSDSRLILTEQPNALPALQSHCDQIVFEEYGFTSYYRGVGAAFNAYHDIQDIFRTPREANAAAVQGPAEVILVVDSGYSHTTVTPVLQGRPLHSAIRRLDVGGKLLTNYLTRLISVRHFDMRNDTYVVNEMKEAACYVSLDFRGDLEKTWKGTRGERREAFLTGGGVAKDYVLPDSHTRFKGVVREYEPFSSSKAARKAAAAAAAAGGGGGASEDDVLTLRNERFVVPEILFNPSDIGLRQPGLADLVMQSLYALPMGLWPGLLANIVVVGGNAMFDNFIQRLQTEVLERVPDDCIVRVARSADPIVSTWQGANGFARHEHAGRLAVTKAEYDEYGASWVARKFAAGLGVD